MAVRELGDPRLEALFGLDNIPDAGVRPVVQTSRKGLPTWVFVAAAAIAALLLFFALEGRRQNSADEQVAARSADTAFAPEPPLYIPPAVQATPVPMLVAPVAGTQPLIIPQVATSPRVVAVAPAPPPPTAYSAPPMQSVAVPAPPQARTVSGTPLVLDGSGPRAAGNQEQAAAGRALGEFGDPLAGGRMRSSSLANRSTTVPQGTLIPAVLETAFNSTRAGLARAIVSRDVRSFDGTNILVPRGSRLIGQYRSEVAAGQNRAVISWTRLLRPDGVTIALNSPAVDPLGRGGIPAHVNTHFGTRLANALLQTTMSLGSNLAMRATTGNVVVALPGVAQAAGPSIGNGNAMPTLTVPAGKSISIFVAHDLEFSSGNEAL